MKWTKERPEVDGWYWFFDVADPEIVEVKDNHVYWTRSGDCSLDELDGEWSGPIPEPED